MCWAWSCLCCPWHQAGVRDSWFIMSNLLTSLLAERAVKCEALSVGWAISLWTKLTGSSPPLRDSTQFALWNNGSPFLLTSVFVSFLIARLFLQEAETLCSGATDYTIQAHVAAASGCNVLFTARCVLCFNLVWEMLFLCARSSHKITLGECFSFFSVWPVGSRRQALRRIYKRESLCHVATDVSSVMCCSCGFLLKC